MHTATTLAALTPVVVSTCFSHVGCSSLLPIVPEPSVLHGLGTFD